MHAALITGKGRLDVVEVPEPRPTGGTVVVAIDRCGICGTDVAAFRDGEPYSPFLCGHEWCGVVTDTGTAATPDAPSEGDRVVLGSPPACGRCDLCRAGHAERCVDLMAIVLDPAYPTRPPHGGYAPRIAVDARRLIPVPPTLPVERAAQLEPATVALHGVRRTPIRTGDVVVVQGCGPIGLLTLQWARLGGAGHVIAVEPDAGRRRRAADLGAQAVEPGPAAFEAVTGANRIGADVVLDCAGTGPALDAAVALARPGGAVTMIGVASTPVTINPGLWLVREVTVRTSLAHTYDDFVVARDYLADGRIDVDALLDRTVALDALGDTLTELASGGSGLCKVLVDPAA